MSRSESSVSQKYTIDTSMLDDFEVQLFYSLLDQLEDIGCIVEP